MADSISDERPIRCPVCLYAMSVTALAKPDAELSCSKCFRSFLVKSGLPGSRTSASTARQPIAIPELEPPRAQPYVEIPGLGPNAPPIASATPALAPLIAAIWVAAALVFSYGIMKSMRGPEFLAFYFLVLAGVWLAVVALRNAVEGCDSVITFTGIATFEGIGVLRYVTASAAGMHRFDNMFLMMVIGAFLMTIRARDLGNGSSSWGDSSFSSCGSGGCGGGGGCGGCGG